MHIACVLFLGHEYVQFAMFRRNETGVPGTHGYGDSGKSSSWHVADDDESVDNAVILNYDNLLLAATLCGAFAMTLSAVLLGLMTLLARMLVQVALVAVITLSFVWGTIGIGLSPRNFVPVTGIIALALSVAYAFIVWDRIPFANANVLTALTAVRSYPTLSVLAMLVQAIALVWSVYLCTVVIGVYDAIQDERLILSDSLTTTLFVALGLSYYWTIQVLSVSQTLKIDSSGVWHQS